MIAAFSTSCSASCEWVWHGQVGDGLQSGAQPPIVAGDVVYLATPEGIGAYVGCRSDAGTCTPLWLSPAGQHTDGTTESDGTLYTQVDETDGTHLLVALTPNGQSIPA